MDGEHRTPIRLAGLLPIEEVGDKVRDGYAYLRTDPGGNEFIPLLQLGSISYPAFAVGPRFPELRALVDRVRRGANRDEYRLVRFTHVETVKIEDEEKLAERIVKRRKQKKVQHG